MTKREARKIATLRTAVVLDQDDTIAQEAGLTLKEADKIQKEQREIAQALAGRYNLSLSDLPFSTMGIVNSVLDGTL